MADKKTAQKVGVGLLAGTIIGMAAGLFLQSKKGKTMTKELAKKAAKLQTKLAKQLGDAEHLTQEKYEEVVNSVMDYYVKTKEIAKSEVPEIRNFLMTRWNEIKKSMKS